MKIGFYISGKATRLCEILTDERSKEIVASISFVITDNLNEGEQIRELCKMNEIHFDYYAYNEVACECTRKQRNEKLSNHILQKLLEREVDYLFVFGHRLLVGELLESYRNRIVCFHPSLLPHFTGFSAIDQAIENKDFVVGNSAFLIDEGVDTGKVIVQSVMHASNFDECDYNKLLHPIVDMFFYVFNVLSEGRLIVTDDKVRIKGSNYEKVSYFPTIE